jgi:exonuclease SbcC
MKIDLKKLALTNFKGIRHLVITGAQVLNIFGDNATGKTTLFDAFLWLLFGKDSTDRKDFEIKTLDENNQPYHRLDHEVEGVLVIDGTEITLRRSYKEKWTKKKGSAQEEFTGHVTTYFWNDVPFKMEDYEKKISGLIAENIFKLLTNTTYYNSMKWQDRRAILMQVAGAINDHDIIDAIRGNISDDHYNSLLAAFKQGKNKDNFKDFRAELGAKKKKIKDELDLMPARIQEANRALPEEKDYTATEDLIATVKTDIESVDGLLMNKSQAVKDHQKEVTILLNKRQEISRLMLDIEFKMKSQVQEKKREREGKIQNEKSELRRLQDELIIARREYSTADGSKKKLVEEQTTLRDKWGLVDAEKLEFKEAEFCCPACQRKFEEADVEQKKTELTNNFNTDKSKRLKEITDRGQAIGTEIADLDTKLTNLKAKGETLNADITTVTNRISELETENTRLSADDETEYKKAITTHEKYNQHKQDVELLTEQIDTPYTGEDNSALLQRKKELNAQLDLLKAEVATKGQREKQQARIDELIAQEGTMAQELASFEGIEFSIEQFTKAKMDMLESRINTRFKIVKFKMFEDQINGGQSEACTTLINGVPYSDANTAAKIQAGLDIINVLNEHYGVYAPVWVDNRESVVRLPETTNQLINLIVSAPDKKLRIESAAMKEVFA